MCVCVRIYARVARVRVDRIGETLPIPFPFVFVERAKIDAIRSGIQIPDAGRERVSSLAKSGERWGNAEVRARRRWRRRKRKRRRRRVEGCEEEEEEEEGIGKGASV